MLSPEEFEALAHLDAPLIANAVETLGVRDRLEGYTGWTVRQLLPELGPMLGYAVTATVDSTTPGSLPDLHAYLALCEAIERAPKPVVLVMHDVSPDPVRGCHVGDNMATEAVALGAVGMVIDSGVRDLAGFRSLRFCVFGPGTVASHGNNHIVAVGQPVTVAGMAVSPGDIIAADENGVVCIPASVAGRIASAARRIQAHEQARQELARRPGCTVAKLRERLQKEQR